MKHKVTSLLFMLAVVLLPLLGSKEAETEMQTQQAGAFTLMLLGGIAIAVVAGLLMPKAKSNRFDQRPPQLATRGQQIPYIIGRRVTPMMPVWVGRRISREERASGGKKGGLSGGSPKETVWYEDGVHVVCLGPASKLHRILRGAEEVIFQGPITPQDTPSGTTLQDVEGNQFKVFWGHATQPINYDLGAADAFDIESRWPFICYIQWIQRRLGSSATWEQIDYDIECSCVGALPLADSECEIPASVPASGEGETYDPGSQDGGMNGAHIAYQILTAASPHGLAMPTSWINWRSLKTYGILMQSEGLAQNMAILDQQPAQDAIAALLGDASILLVEEKGLLNFNPQRDDDPAIDITDNVHVVPSPEFSIEHGGLGGTRNVFIYPSVEQNFNEDTITTDDDATAYALKRRKTQEIRLPTITHPTHAKAIADRKKQLFLTEGNQIKLKANRTMRRLMPGQVANLASVGSIRVTGIERETSGHSVTVTASLDQFSLVDSGWNPILPTPAPPPSTTGADTEVRVFEVPRKYAGETLAIAVIRGRSGGDSTKATVFTSLNGISYTEAGSEDYVAALGTLAEDFLHQPVGYEPFRLHVEEGPTILFSSTNMAKVLDLSGQDDEWRANRQVMLIGDEIMAVRSFTALGSGSFTPNDILREQLFTQRDMYQGVSELPVMVFEPENLTLISRGTWSVGSTLFVKVVPRGESLDTVEPIQITLTGKALGALPVMNISPLVYLIDFDIDFTWDYQLNLGSGAAAGELPVNTPIPADPGDEGDFLVEVLDEGGVLKRSTVVDSPAWTYTTTDMLADALYGGRFLLRVTARKGGMGGYPVTRLIEGVAS